MVSNMQLLLPPVPLPLASMVSNMQLLLAPVPLPLASMVSNTQLLLALVPPHPLSSTVIIQELSIVSLEGVLTIIVMLLPISVMSNPFLL